MKSVIAALIASAFVTPASAQATQQKCGPWKETRERFEKQFHEVVTSVGLVNKDNILIVIASPNGASFTIFMLDRNGIACAMAAGTGWEPGTNPLKPSVRS